MPMRRLLAALAAVAMLAGGFLVWNTRRNSNGASGSSTTATGAGAAFDILWCVPEAVVACRRVAGRVEQLTPADIESRLTAPGISASQLQVDAIVATKPWLDRWLGIPIGLHIDPTPVASTQLVAVEKVGGPGCAGDLTCLLKRGSRLALPDLASTSAGTVAAALAIRSKGVTSIIDALAPAVVTASEQVKESLATPRNSVEALQALLQINLLDAAVMTRSEFDSASPANATVSVLKPAGAVTLHIGVLGNGKPANLRKRLGDALTAEGWTPPVPDAASLSTEFLNQTYNLLR
jgi:hypothetical protein